VREQKKEVVQKKQQVKQTPPKPEKKNYSESFEDEENEELENEFVTDEFLRKNEAVADIQVPALS
jgi:hypothetical protein